MKLPFCSRIVLRFLVVDVDVDTDACDDNQCGDELNPIVVNASEEVTENENNSAYDGGDNA